MGTATSWLYERVDDDDGEIYYAVHRKNDFEFIGNIYSNETDARLIAAAPDLLAALQELKRAVATEVIFGGAGSSVYLDAEHAALAAIGKATEELTP